MNDLQIKYFLGIVDNNINFTKASKALFVSQPALSKHINTLEKEFGVKLFNTSVKSSIRLTPAGERLYRLFSEYMQDLAKAIKEAKWANNQASGEIKIAVPTGWNLSALSHQFNSFQSQYPNIALYMYSAGFKAIEGGIQKNNYDLAITPSFHLDALKEMENICIREICVIPVICLYSSRHRLAAKKNLTIADFKDDVLYTLSTEETPLAWMRCEAYCNSKGFVPKIKSVPNIDSIFLALEQGSGYTLLDQWQRIKDHPSFGYITCDAVNAVCAVWKKDNQNAMLRAFLYIGIQRKIFRDKP